MEAYWGGWGCGFNETCTSRKRGGVMSDECGAAAAGGSRRERHNNDQIHTIHTGILVHAAVLFLTAAAVHMTVAHHFLRTTL